MAQTTLAVSFLNTVANAFEAALGTEPIHEFFTGSAPANCEAADSGTKIVTITAPSDWLGNASNGVKTIANGPWTEVEADETGTIGHFRSKTSGGVCILQGKVGVTGDTTAIVTVSTTAAVAGVPIQITGYTFTAAGGS